MADTNTPSLNLVLPEVGASSDTWGTKINSDLTAIDNLFSTGPYLKVANGGTGAGTAATAATNLGLGTGDSPQFTAVNIGHASDTTITRSAAGVIAVEGGVIPKENRANTFTANQIISVTDNTNAALRVTQLGTGAAIRVEDETNPDSTPFIVDASGNVGIGTASPAYKLDISTTGTSIGARIQTNQQDATLSFLGSGGVNGYVRVGASDNNLFFMAGNAERMRINSSGNVGIGTTSPGNKLTVNGASGAGIAVTNSASGTGASNGLQLAIDATTGGYLWNYSSGILSFGTGGGERFRIDASNNVLVTSSGGLGYGTGSGGTVTQATNKTTAVTLNKTNGKITLSNATLTAGQSVTFDVNNSTVAATDTVIISMAYTGSGAGNYNYHVGELGAGYFTVCIKNVSAISLSDAVIFNFSVIKATTS